MYDFMYLQFTAIAGAYEVLGRPKTRHIYDSHGEFGLTVLEKTGSYGLTDFVLNRKKQAWIAGVLLILFLTFLSFPFLVAYKDRINAPLSLICIPLWIFHGLLYATIWLFVILSARMSVSDGSRTRSFSIYWWPVLYLGIVAFNLMAVLKLDGIIRLDWLIVFIPYYIFEGLYLILKTVRIIQAARIWPGDDLVLPLVKGAFFYLIYQEFRWSFMRGVFGGVTLVRLKNAHPSITWEVAFLIGYLSLACAPIFDIMYWRAYKFAARESRNSERLPNRIITLTVFIVYITAILTLLIFLGLLHVWVQPDSQIGLFWVLFPFLCLSGCIGGTMILCIPCIFCCCIPKDDTMYDDDEVYQPSIRSNCSKNINPTTSV